MIYLESSCNSCGKDINTNNQSETKNGWNQEVKNENEDKKESYKCMVRESWRILDQGL